MTQTQQRTFLEENIRPQERLETYQEIYRREWAARLDPATGRPPADLVESVRCPLCAQDHALPVATPLGFTLVKCGECGLHYLHPRPRREVLEDFYNRSESQRYFRQEILTVTSTSRREHIFSPRAAQVCARVPQGRLLDVGCAGGDFLTVVANETQLQPEGLEICRTMAQEAERRTGFRVHPGALEDSALSPRSYDAVTCWDTIHLMPDPLGFLERARRLLRKGGWVFFSTTNIRGFDYACLGADHPNVLPTYLFHFTPSTVEEFLRRAGFARVHITTPGRLDVDIVRRRRCAEDFRDQAFLQTLLFQDGDLAEERRRAFQTFLQDHQMSGYLHAEAQV